MSAEDDLEILFENVSSKQRLSVDRAQKIKSEATEYLTKRRAQLLITQTGSRFTSGKRKNINQSAETEIGECSNNLQYKSVKHANRSTKQVKNGSAENNITGHDLPEFYQLETSNGSSFTESVQLACVEENVLNRKKDCFNSNIISTLCNEQAEDNVIRSVHSPNPQASTQNVEISNVHIFPKTTSKEGKAVNELKDSVLGNSLNEQIKDNGLVPIQSSDLAITTQNVRISNMHVSPKTSSEEKAIIGLKASPLRFSHSSTNGSSQPSINLSPVLTPSKKTETNNSRTQQFSDSPSEKQNIRLSHQIQRHPKKFSINGSPASSHKNSYLYSNKKISPKSVNKSSPLTFMRNKFLNNESPSVNGVKRKLNFFGGSSKLSNLQVGTLSEVKDPGLDPIANTSEWNLDGYQYRQFKLHIDEVLRDDNSASLISTDEKYIIDSFDEMNSQCQDLYARMHKRKFKWNKLSDIKYGTAIEENVCTLEDKGFISTEMQNVEMETLLELLKISEIKEVCKSLGIKCTVQNKKTYTEEIKRYCQTQKTIVGSAEDVVRKRTKSVLGLCFKLQPEPRDLFRRIHLLFNLKFSRNELTRHGSQDLFEIQFLGTSPILYPMYRTDTTARIFSSRADLLKYHAAEDFRYEYFLAVGAKDWNKAGKILDTVRNNFIEEFGFLLMLEESATEIHETASAPAMQLPLSLRRFTPGAVYAYILSDGVDVLKRLKENEKAISDLLLLLDQNTYLPYMRGRWYEKLIIIHRKAGNLVEVAKTILIATHDPYIDDQASYVLSCRVKDLLKKKKGVSQELKSLLKDIPLFPPLESVEPVEIRACTLEGKIGFKRVYVQDDETGDGKTYSSVEELVKNYYCPGIFKRGFHAENSLPNSLLGILFWDVIYEHYVPCAFISKFQSKPWDLSTGDFYKNRKEVIDKKLEEMPKWSADEIASWVNQIYSENNGRASLVHWTWFRSSEEILDIINCIGLEIVLKICERLLKKYRGVRGGFPDLFLWTPGKPKEYKFVEVKSHNDKLSVNQKLWLDFLIKIKANVDVCLVQAKGSKTMKTTPMAELDKDEKIDGEEDECIDEDGKGRMRCDQ